MFDSQERLKQDITAMLEALRTMASGRYACVVDPKGVRFESPSEPEDREGWALRRLLEERRQALFGLPAALESGAELADVFEGWEHDEVLLAVINGRVAVVVTCREAERFKEASDEPLAVLADRLLRYNPAWRTDEHGRGFFFGRPRLDLVVVGPAR
jgi:hypothetical protein